MEKLTSILMVARNLDTSEVLLDKAISLARRFGARVDLLLTNPTTTSAFATRCTELGCDDIVSYVLHGSNERVAEVILRRLREHPADLVMKHPARPRALRRLAGGIDDIEIVARSSTPVMLVSDRPWGRVPRFAAAVDVSERDGDTLARGLVHAAGLLAMGCDASLDVLYSEREKRDETLRAHREVRLAQLVREFNVGCERLQVFDGAPEKTLPAIVAARQYDVLVVGALSHRQTVLPWAHTLTSTLVEATHGDVLLVDVTGHESRNLATLAVTAPLTQHAHT